MKSICKTSEDLKGRGETYRGMVFLRLYYGQIWHLGYTWKAIFEDEMTPSSNVFLIKPLLVSVLVS